MLETPSRREEPFPNDPERPETVRTSTNADIAGDLQALRAAAGHPSYAQLVLRIAQDRQARGIDPVAARPARTTVYDCFRPGRTRINSELVGEIVLALTRDEEQAREWVQRCNAARAAREQQVAERGVAEILPEHAPEPEPTPAPTPPRVPEPAPAPARAEKPGPAAPVGEKPAATPVIRARPRLTPRLVALTVLAGLVLNIAGNLLSRTLELRVFLDMIGTALTSMVLGPWVGAAVGLTSHLVGSTVIDPSTVGFGIVQVAGALAWGYGVRRFRMGVSVARLCLLCVVTALLCTVVATPIVALTMGVGKFDPARPLMDRMFELSGTYLVSVFVGNLYYSLVDKLLAGFVAVALIGSSPRLAASAPDVHVARSETATS